MAMQGGGCVDTGRRQIAWQTPSSLVVAVVVDENGHRTKVPKRMQKYNQNDWENNALKMAISAGSIQGCEDELGASRGAEDVPWCIIGHSNDEAPAGDSCMRTNVKDLQILHRASKAEVKISILNQRKRFDNN